MKIGAKRVLEKKNIIEKNFYRVIYYILPGKSIDRGYCWK
jgi:hypothetical protein